MYAPYWVDESVKKGPCSSLNATPEIGRSKQPVGVTGDHDHWMTLKPVDKNPKTKKPFGRDTWPKILRLKTGARNVLGMNFLNGKKPNTNEPDKLNSPKKLAHENDPGENRPGMYCVAINNIVLGQQINEQPPLKPSLNTKTNLGLQSGPGSGDPPPLGLSPIIDQPLSASTSAVDKNIRSISCVVLWKNGDEVRFSHYFAGDAMWEAEARILRWTQNDGALSVAATKISHHGAVNATPLNFFDILDPAKVIVSAGHDMSFGHPRWEFLFLLHSWVLLSQRTGCLLCTNYPAYLIRRKSDFKFPQDNSTTTTVFATLVYTQNDEPEVNTDLVYDAYRRYKEKLQEYFKKTDTPGMVNLKDLWSEFNDSPGMKTAVQDDDVDTQWIWIATKTEQLWKTLAPMGVGVRTASATGGAVSGPPAGEVLSKDEILYIKLMSRNSDNDGETLVVGCDGKGIGQNVGKRHTTTIPVATSPSHTAVKEVVTGPPSEKMARLDSSSGVSTVPKATDLKATTTKDGRVIKRVIRGAPVARYPGRRPRDERTNTVTNLAKADSADGYYIYCSGTITTLDSSSATVLTAASVLDQLVSSLHYAQLVFTSKPSTSPTSFLANDQWNIYFTSCFDSSKLSATANKDGNIDAFQLSFDFPAAGANTLVFSSAAAPILYNFGQSAALPAPGMLTDPCILVFGLDVSSTAAWTDGVLMMSLVQYAGLENTASLMSNLKVTLDRGASRNAIWFTPWSDYKTVLRLVFTAKSDDLETFLGGVDGFTKISCSGVSVVLSATHTMLRSTGISALRGATLTILASCSIRVSSSSTMSFEMVLEIGQNSLGITLLSDTSVKLSTILDWLKSVIGLQSDFEIRNWLQTKLGIQDVSISLRRIFINLDTQNTLSVSSVGLDLEVKWANASSSRPVVFLFNYTRWVGQSFGTFNGCLWCQPDASLVLDYRKMLPEWEDWKDYHPDCSTPAGYLDFKDLFPGVPALTNIPKGLPTKIARACMQISDDQIIFGGAIICSPPPITAFPSLSLADLELNASYTWGSELDLELIIGIDLLPSNTSAFQEVARLRGDLIYGGSSWSISASIEDFRAAALYSLFEAGSRDTVMPLIEALKIRTLYLDYMYGSGGEPSSFSCTGTLLLGPLELDLTFNHVKGSWQFFATLESNYAEERHVSLGEIVQEVIPDAQLRDFVANIAISTPLIQLAAVKSRDSGVVFSLVCTDRDFSFTFAQHCAAASGARKKPKRVLKFAFKPFPAIPIPLVGQLAQPFEEIYYLWVQDSGSQGATTASGLTLNETARINEALGREVLLYKNKAGTTPTDIVIQSGSHLVVVARTGRYSLQVIIDYHFSTGKNETASSTQRNQSGHITPAHAAAEDGDTNLGPDSVMAPLHSKQNGVTISNIGLQYVSSSKTIVILLDATFTLGPISFALLGFGLKIPLSNGTLRDLPTPVPVLSGLGLSFDQQPIDIAGLFEVLTNDGSTKYEGGAIISLPEYEFLGAGYYGEDAAGYKSVFAFAELVGPLLSLEFAELSGVKGGFGYNSSLTLPTQQNVASFPLVGQSFRVNDNALSALKQLFQSRWIKSSQGDYWAAAGGRIDALQMLFVDAAFVCEFGHGLKLGVIADLVVHIPPPVSSEGRRFVFVNIGLLSTIDLGQGILLVAGQVGRDSFLLDPACGLSGEFAFSYWFGSNARAGQWVFTIGGYHHAFQRPTYYPQADRLTIGWTVDSNISISGQGYFAVTPKLCMGGGMLKAEYSNGDLHANFTAFADFLILYDPFYFTADAGVIVSGRYSPWWLLTGPASAHVDATLHLEGPPLCGSVTVEFFGFQKTFYFGTQKPRVHSRATLEKFYTLLQTEDKTRTHPHLITCVSGRVPKSKENRPTSEQGDVWVVRGGKLSFRVSSPFAFRSVTYNSGTAITHDQAIYSTPMMLSGSQKIESSLSVDIFNDNVKITEAFTMTKVVSNLPAALWGSYDQQIESHASRLNGNRNTVVPLMASVLFMAPVPQALTTRIPPFNIVKSMSKRVFPDDKTPKFPSRAVDSYSAYWAPDEADSDEEQQYRAVENDWCNPAISDGAKSSLSIVSSAMGWPDEVVLKSDPPKIALKKLDSVYASAPLIGRRITS